MLLSSFFARSMAFTHTPRVQLPFALFSETFLTIRQNSLYVTVCIIARPSYRGYFIHSLSTLHYCNAPSLATRLTGDYRNWTFTGKCGPASLDTRHKKRPCPFGHSQMPKNLEKRKASADICLRRTIFLSISILSSIHFHCNTTYLPMLCQFTTYLLPFFFQSFFMYFFHLRLHFFWSCKCPKHSGI